MVSAVKVGGRRLHELARQGIEVERPARSGDRLPLRHRARPRAPGRVPGRGGVLVGDLRPRAGPRPRDGARRRGARGQPAAHPHRLVRRGRDAPARPHRPRRGPHAGRGHARPRRGDGRSGGRGLDPHRAAPRQGAARGRGRRALGHARRAGETCWPSTRRRAPTGSGRPWCWPGSDGHRTTLGRDVGPGTAVTIGAYDGVHLGHRALLRDLSARAEAAGLSTVVVTFDRHPASVVRPESAPKQLTGLEQKLELLADCGIDRTLVRALRRGPGRGVGRGLREGGPRRRAVRPARRGGGGLPLRARPPGQRRAPAPARRRVRVRGGRRRPDRRRVASRCPPPASGRCSPRATWRGRPACSAARTRSAASSSAVTVGAAPNWGSRRPTWPSPTTSRCPPTPSTPGTTGGPTGRCTGPPSRWGAGPPSTSRARRRYWWRPISCTSTGTSTGSAARVSFAHRLRDEQRFDSIDALVAQMRADVEATERVLASADLP